MYAAPTLSLLPVFVVVASELPEERGTLLVRLMGAGATLRRAVREARFLAEDAWERRPAMIAVRMLRSRIEVLEPQDPELAMEITETYEQWEARVTREARAQARSAALAEGKTEGKAESALRLLSRRFGPLAPPAEARVRGASASELDAILDRVLIASSLEEALG